MLGTKVLVVLEKKARGPVQETLCVAFEVTTSS